MANESSFFQAKQHINLGGELMDLSTCKVVGILNLTPDSFYDGGKFTVEKKRLQKVELMLTEGADIIDIGAFSSRPGAQMISEKEERKRLIPALKSIVKNFPGIKISIDTYRSTIAKEVVENGAVMINDISGGDFDPKMFDTIAELQVPYVLMHTPAKPVIMQENPSYENVLTEITKQFSGKVRNLRTLGVNDILLDPGFGFGKSLEHNYTLLHHLSHFRLLGCPLYVGISRKGMIQKIVHEKAADALNGTTAAHMFALAGGASFLRVHDVKAARQAINMHYFIQKH
jgi:dihydropteroate synthase